MNIQNLHHVQITIPVGQEEAGREFYCGLLGLAEVDKPSSLQSRGGFWLQVGDLQVHVGVEEGVHRTQTKAHVAYLVDDLVAWRERLKSMGVEVLDNQPPIPGYRRFEFRDPFGNRVELLEGRED